MRVFSRNFAGEVTKEKCALYHAALKDVEDAQLEEAAVRVIKEHRGEFIPTVAVVRDAAGANTRGVAIDLDRMLAAISALGEYHVDSGRYRYPSPGRVEAALGPAVAEAYGEAGSALLFASSDVTREIAQRDFLRALTRTVARRGASALALPMAAAPALQIGAGEQQGL